MSSGSSPPVSELDLLTVGRVNLDLYARQVGVPFDQVRGWDATVGGSPTNVAVAAARLGLSAALFTAVGDDHVGDWALRALERERVRTEYVARKQGPHTSLALRAQLAPDHPLAFYRHDPADIHLTAADAAEVPVEGARVLLVSADALARGSTPNVCMSMLERARAAGTPVFVDLDLREVSWPDLRAYAAAAGAAAKRADVVLGTEAEFEALLGLAPSSDDATLPGAVRARLGIDSGSVAVLKRGDRGATLLIGADNMSLPAFPIAEAVTVGAGDSFAAALIFARLRGDEWRGAARFASACAAITVSRFGCSAGFPELQEVVDFMERDTPLARSGG
jgi:5-dehydro-2-deoxygluconokinase